MGDTKAKLEALMQVAKTGPLPEMLVINLLQQLLDLRSDLSHQQSALEIIARDRDCGWAQSFARETIIGHGNALDDLRGFLDDPT